MYVRVFAGVWQSNRSIETWLGCLVVVHRRGVVGVCFGFLAQVLRENFLRLSRLRWTHHYSYGALLAG